MLWYFLSCLRAVFTLLFYPFFLVGCSAVAVVLMLLGLPVNGMISFWTRGSLLMTGVRMNVKGWENIPKNRGFLLLFNHTSFFDIFIIHNLLPQLRFGAKIELFKIPMFGRAMRMVGVLPIARNNPEEVYKVYREAEPKMKAGQIYALAPEGTRQDGGAIGPFKAGPFIFAINTQAPIVPCVLRGAHHILPKHHVLPNWGCWQRTVEVEFLPLVETSQYNLENRVELQNLIHEKMQQAYLDRTCH